MRQFIFLLFATATVLTSYNDETAFKEDDSLKGKIQSLKSAKSAEGI